MGYTLSLYADPKTAAIGTPVRVYGYLYSDSTPVANAIIRIHYVDQEQYPKTDSKGYFETYVTAVLYANVCTAAYYDIYNNLRATAQVTITGTFPTVPPGVYSITLNAEKSSAPTGSQIKVYGYLRSDSTPIAGANVEIEYAGKRTTVTTDSKGYFEVMVTVAYGYYDLCANYYTPDTKQLAARTCISLVGEAVYQVTVKTDKTNYYIGDDIKVSGNLTMNNQPAAGMTVEVEMNGNTKLVSTSGDGTYSTTFKAASVGTFTITARYASVSATTSVTVSPKPSAESYVAAITIAKKSPSGNPRPGEAITFSGYVKDNMGNPVPNQLVTAAEKDILGRYWPIKNKADQYVFARTDSNGYYELYDDDGWPDAGVKTVWAITNKVIGKDIRVDGLYGVVPSDGERVLSDSLTIEVSAAPTEYTHVLRLYFIPLPWASQRQLEEAIPSIAGAVNPFITPLGYDYVGGSVNWQGRYVDLYYRKRGTPPIPLAEILAVVAIAAILGVVYVSAVWYEVKMKELELIEYQYRTKAELQQEAMNLYKQGQLTYDQLQQTLKTIDESYQLPEQITKKCKLLGMFEIPIPAEWCDTVNGIVALGLLGLGMYAAYKIISSLGKK